MWRAIAWTAAALFAIDQAQVLMAEGLEPPGANRLRMTEFAIRHFGLIACPLLVAAALVRAPGRRFVLTAIPVVAQFGPLAVLYVWRLMTRQLWMGRAMMLGICAALTFGVGVLLATAGLWTRRKIVAIAGLALLLAGGIAGAALAFVFSFRPAWDLDARFWATALLDWLALVAFLELTPYHGGVDVRRLDEPGGPHPRPL